MIRQLKEAPIEAIRACRPNPARNCPVWAPGITGAFFMRYSMRFFALVLLVFGLLAVGGNRCEAQTETTLRNLKNSKAVQRVLVGRETAANAAWWGFDAVDSTAAIQGAINSGASKVVIPYVGKEWIVKPITLASNQEIVFEPGVVVIAQKNSFKGTQDCLFSALEATNVTLRGYGAVVRMRKGDYKKSTYPKSEYRHAIRFLGCENIKVLGLRIESSGGDGIYIGATRDKRFVPCKNVLIRDCVSDDNYRQGMSVTSADTVLIENCVLSNTRGTLPAAGIDMEVHNPKDVLANIVISNCVSKNNSGSGFIASISRLSESSRDVSILFVNCYAKNCGAPGLRVRANNESGPKGLIEFKNCTSEGITYAGIYAVWKLTSPMKLKFSNCKVQDVAKRSKEPPIGLELAGRKTTSLVGGVEFIDCYVYDKKNRPFLKIIDSKSGQGIYEVRGDINVFSPWSPRIDAGAYTKDLPLKIRNFPAR